MSALNNLAGDLDRLAARQDVSSYASGAYSHAARLIRLTSDKTTSDYELLSTLIVDLFNPPKSDTAMTSLLIAAVCRAHKFIADQPCRCALSALDGLTDPCTRCQALGRISDRKVDR